MIKIKNLKKTYDDKTVKALNGINLEIKEGEFVSIIGPSGSGKSTLLNMIGALDIAEEGEIEVAGFDLVKTQDLSEFRSKRLGFVFQLHNLIPNLTAIENVQMPLLESSYTEKKTESQRIELAKNILEKVGLGEKIDKKPTKLSGGERQRVAIARALINNPSIILADEPTGSLDSKTGQVILNLLKDLHEKEKTTLILVTHDPNVANMAGRVITVLDGKIQEDKINT
ncbi:MAG: ABC transporter ATP-binding protein [Methanobacteriaceae archaeon]